jgi:hypothetical protein
LGRWVSDLRSRLQHLIRKPRMPAEAILALGRIGRAICYFDLTEQAVGGLVRSSKYRWRQRPLNTRDDHAQGDPKIWTQPNDQDGKHIDL